MGSDLIIYIYFCHAKRVKGSIDEVGICTEKMKPKTAMVSQGSVHAFGEDAMLKTLFDNGKPIYGVGSIAAMVKPSFVFWVVGLCGMGVGGGGAGVRGGGWKGGLGGRSVWEGWGLCCVLIKPSPSPGITKQKLNFIIILNLSPPGGKTSK